MSLSSLSLSQELATLGGQTGQLVEYLLIWSGNDNSSSRISSMFACMVPSASRTWRGNVEKGSRYDYSYQHPCLSYTNWHALLARENFPMATSPPKPEAKVALLSWFLLRWVRPLLSYLCQCTTMTSFFFFSFSKRNSCKAFKCSLKWEICHFLTVIHIDSKTNVLLNSDSVNNKTNTFNYLPAHPSF